MVRPPRLLVHAPAADATHDLLVRDSEVQHGVDVLAGGHELRRELRWRPGGGGRGAVCRQHSAGQLRGTHACAHHLRLRHRAREAVQHEALAARGAREVRLHHRDDDLVRDEVAARDQVLRRVTQRRP